MKQPALIQSVLASLSQVFSYRKRPADPAAFKTMFDTFQKVLESNNKALETITDMGEKLGGDYLFDIVYVRRASARLREDMELSLLSFDRLTRSRYARLRNRFEEIDERIEHVINDTVPVPDALVVPYEKISNDMAGIVGNKNNNLAVLQNFAKLRVPDAFAITTRAFDAFLRHNRLFDKVMLPPAGTPLDAASYHELHEQILHGSMPPELASAIKKAVKKIRLRRGIGCTLAVRSSAGEEDGEFSFAGQFETVLNVPLDQAAVEKAYRKVVASLYSEKAAAYQARLGFDVRDMKMAVACVVMVDAAASGVMYSSSPDGDRSTVVINATWGLGASVVEGSVDADLFKVKKNERLEITESRIGAKESMIVPNEQGDVLEVPVSEDRKHKPSLSKNQIEELARQAQTIEAHFRTPQDIEWAIDRKGDLFILQSRSLRMPENGGHATVKAAASSGKNILLKDQGIIVQTGAATGKVFILKNDRDLSLVPKGAVLVAPRDSSLFVRVMTDVSAIITEVGTPTSHMAALCREFRIPTIVNTAHAMKLLTHGQDVTIAVESEGATVYEGLDRELVERALDNSMRMDELSEFRKKRYLLRYVAPLNLIDPLRDEFTPQACRTMHDILRFIHEKSVAELVRHAEYGVASGAIKLDLPIPAGLMLIDIGGGLHNPEGLKQVTAREVASIPLQAIIKGMTLPGLWRSDAVPLKVNDFMASMLRVPDLTTEAGRVVQNMAVISHDYANISLKFGYHFIVMDCFCSEKAKNNHIYFRFAGGATDISKRSRRLSLIAAILGEFGFTIKTKGDLIIARLANIEQPAAVKVLEQLGRLFSYTRQLDAVLNDDQAVERYARSFLEGTYELQAGEKSVGSKA